MLSFSEDAPNTDAHSQVYCPYGLLLFIKTKHTAAPHRVAPPLPNSRSQYFTCRLGASPLQRRCCTKDTQSVNQSQSRYNQQITVSILQLHSATDRERRQHNRKQGAQGSASQPPLERGVRGVKRAGSNASTSEQQRGQNKEPIRIRAAVFFPVCLVGSFLGFFCKGSPDRKCCCPLHLAQPSPPPSCLPIRIHHSMLQCLLASSGGSYNPQTETNRADGKKSGPVGFERV